jgi:hypothetical protein
MKHLKLISLSFLAIVATTLTSCLGNSDSTKTYSGIVEVTSSMGVPTFTELSSSTKIYCTSTSLTTVETNYKFNPTTGLAYIYGTYTEDSSTKTVTVDLTYACMLQNQVISTTTGAANDSTSNAPITNVDSSLSNGFTLLKSTNTSNTYLYTALNYGLNTTGLSYSYSGHYFTLMYYKDKTNSGDTNLDLYLMHHSNTPSGTSTTTSSVLSSSLPWSYLMSFNITSILTDYRLVSSQSNPTTVTLHIPIGSATTPALNEYTSYKVSFTSSSN